MAGKPLLEILKIANDLCKTSMVGHSNGLAAPGSLTGGAALAQGTFEHVHPRSLNDQRKDSELKEAREQVPPHLRDKFAEASAKEDPIRSKLFMLQTKIARK
jgi:hypothetical protein